MLLNDTDLKKEMSLNPAFTHAKVIPHIRNVENSEVKPILGNALYSSLNSAYNTVPQGLSEVQLALLEYVRPIVGNLAMYQYAGKGTMHIDDTGFSVKSTDKMKPASETKIVNYRISCMNSGFNAIDDLIEFLEEHASDYPLWASSDAAKAARALLIPSAKEFQKLVNIRHSRRMYLLLSPVMLRVEENELTATIGQDLYLEIKAQLESLTISPTNTLLLTKMRRAIAHLTWSKSINELSLIIDERGVHLFNNSFSGDVEAKTPAETLRIDHLVSSHEDIGTSALGDLKTYLQTKADDYPLYKDSEAYIDEDNGETDFFENDPESGMVFI